MNVLIIKNDDFDRLLSYEIDVILWLHENGVQFNGGEFGLTVAGYIEIIRATINLLIFFNILPPPHFVRIYDITIW